MPYDEYNCYYEEPPPKKILVCCGTEAIAAALRLTVNEHTTVVHYPNTIDGDSLFDIVMLTFEPLTPKKQIWYHKTYNSRLAKGGEFVWSFSAD